ncbi:9359_t:CDS:2, partial [Racocetra persica]
ISEFIQCDKSDSDKKVKLLKTGLRTDISEHILSNVNNNNILKNHEKDITGGTNSASNIENIYYDNDDKIELDSQLARYITFNLQSESLDLESIKDNFTRFQKSSLLQLSLD